VETYTGPRPLVDDPSYDDRREKALRGLGAAISSGLIDEPILDVVKLFSRLPHCYTIQSCCGHFVSESRADERDLERVADLGDTVVDLHYRIAYMAFCVQNSPRGRLLLERLRTVADIDHDYVQFGSSDWFWKTCPNTYVLQVSPRRFAQRDSFDVSKEEALHIERTKDRFFDRLRGISSENENIERV
jgi:hypothetical protein